MLKPKTNKLTIFLSLATCLLLAKSIVSKGYRVSSPRASTRTYTQKAPYAGYGKQSKVNGMIKTKPVSGHFKPSDGYKFVNSYARSK